MWCHLFYKINLLLKVGAKVWVMRREFVVISRSGGGGTNELVILGTYVTHTMAEVTYVPGIMYLLIIITPHALAPFET